MQIFRRNGDVVLRAEYSPGLTDAMKRVPGATWREWEWIIPEASVGQLRKELGLLDANLYPWLKDLIDPTNYPGLSAEVWPDHAVIRCPENPDSLMKNIDILCAYDRVEKKRVAALKRTYHVRIWTSLARIERDTPEPGAFTVWYPPGLADRIVDFLSIYAPDRVARNARPAPQPCLPVSQQVLKTLRPYQLGIVEQVPNRPRATICMPTGSGKSLTAAGIIARLRIPTLFLTYQAILLHQTADTFRKQLRCPVGVVGDAEFELHPITVATVQTISALFDGIDAAGWVRAIREGAAVPNLGDAKKESLLKYLATVELVFVDEGHQLGAETIFAAATLADPYYAYALTATPTREDGKDIYIEAAAGRIWRPKGTRDQELIEAGYLLPVKVRLRRFVHPPAPNVSLRQHNKYETETIVNNHRRNAAIVSLVLAAGNARTLVLTKREEHAQILAELLHTEYLSAQIPVARRREVIEQFAEGQLRRLVATPLLDQGVDIPAAEVLVDATPRRSVIKILQTIGRVRRPDPSNPKKDHALVLALYDDDQGLWLKQSKRRVSVMRQAGFDVGWLPTATSAGVGEPPEGLEADQAVSAGV